MLISCGDMNDVIQDDDVAHFGMQHQTSLAFLETSSVSIFSRTIHNNAILSITWVQTFIYT